MGTVAIDVGIVATVSACNSYNVDLMVFREGKVDMISVEQGKSFRTGFVFEIPEERTNEFLAAVVGAKKISDIEQEVGAELSDILINFSENPHYDVQNGIDSLMRILTRQNQK